MPYLGRRCRGRSSGGREAEVERVRQEERERFKQGLPADKVLYVDADEVTQAWTLAGTWALEGDIANSNEFRIELKKSDYRHGPVETDRLNRTGRPR